MRSKFLSDLRTELSLLNNSFSHYAFVWEQFIIDNNTIIKENESSLTTKIYTKNNNASQFNVQLKYLDNSHSKTFAFLTKSMFLLAYSAFEVYMRTIYEFTRKIKTSLPNLNVRETLPDKIFEHLAINVDEHFSVEEIETFKYLRLRRNRVIHSGSQSKGELADLIRQKGNGIQRFWINTLTNGLYRFNFQSDNIDTLEKEELFDLINIIRYLTTKIDNLILNSLQRKVIIIALKDLFNELNQAKLKSWKTSKRNRKMINYFSYEFNLTLDAEEKEMISIKSDVA